MEIFELKSNLYPSLRGRCVLLSGTGKTMVTDHYTKMIRAILLVF